MLYARKYVIKELSPLQNNCLRAISGAYKARPIRNLEVEVGVPPLAIHLDSLQAQFRVRLEESEAAGVIKEAVEKVERWLSGAQGQMGRRRGRIRANRRTSGESRGGMKVTEGASQVEGGGQAGEARGSEMDGWEGRAPHSSPHGTTTTLHQL